MQGPSSHQSMGNMKFKKGVVFKKETKDTLQLLKDKLNLTPEDKTKVKTRLINLCSNDSKATGTEPELKDVFEAVEEFGKKLLEEQSQKSKLNEQTLKQVDEVYTLLKILRKSTADLDKGELRTYERNNRYSYKKDDQHVKVSDNQRASSKNETAWTSYFKDVLAYNDYLHASQRDGKNYKPKVLITMNEYNALLGQMEKPENIKPESFNQLDIESLSDETSNTSFTAAEISAEAAQKPKKPQTYDEAINNEIRVLDKIRDTKNVESLKNALEELKDANETRANFDVPNHITTEFMRKLDESIMTVIEEKTKQILGSVFIKKKS